MTTESDGNVTLTIRVFSHPGGAPRPFTLTVNTEDGTASKCCNFWSEDISSVSLSYTAVVDNDYVPVSGQIIQFNRGDVTQNHTITINDDDECERDQNENFFSKVSLNSGIPNITVTLPQATVTIGDTAELDCGKQLQGRDHN